MRILSWMVLCLGFITLSMCVSKIAAAAAAADPSDDNAADLPAAGAEPDTPAGADTKPDPPPKPPGPIPEDQKCGKPQTPPSKGFRIVGGGSVQNNSWPWACALVQEVNRPGKGMTYRQFCDCTLIDKDWVVTAAHCTEGLTRAQFLYYVKVYMGDEDLNQIKDDPSKKYGVEKLIVHESFIMRTKQADVALIKLKRTVGKFSNDLKPACLPTHHILDGEYVKSGPKDRRLCFVGGWGHTYEGEMGKRGVVGSGTDKMRQTSTEIYPWTECKKKLPITDTMICAGFDQGKRDTCQGDSGGPMVCDDGDNTWMLYGIVSWGPGCARAGSPGVYTNVWRLESWIRMQTGVNFTALLPSSSRKLDTPLE